MSMEYLENLLQKAAAAGQYFDYGCDETELAYLTRLAGTAGTKVIAEIGSMPASQAMRF
jgi:hypothetical protein